jgi:hypothetical protein
MPKEGKERVPAWAQESEGSTVDLITPQNRSAAETPLGLGDQIYSRLLRERIVFLARSFFSSQQKIQRRTFTFTSTHQVDLSMQVWLSTTP